MKKNILILAVFSLSFAAIGQTRNVNKKQSIDNGDVKTHSEITRSFQELGLVVSDLTEKEKEMLRVTNGIKVIGFMKGRAIHLTQMRVGFIILKVNNIPINSSDQFHEELSRLSECSVILEGIYEDSPSVCYYAFELE